jgi:hypothetical protein
MNDDDANKISASSILAAQEGLAFQASQAKAGTDRLRPAPLLPDNLGNMLLPNVFCQAREGLVANLLRVFFFVVWCDRARFFLPTGAMQSDTSVRQYLWNLVIAAVPTPMRDAFATTVGDWQTEPPPWSTRCASLLASIRKRSHWRRTCVDPDVPRTLAAARYGSENARSD